MDDVHSFQLTTSDGTTLHAHHWAARTPHATLAIIHGFGEHSGRYADMAHHLTEQGIDVFAVDLRGHGRSEGKRGVIQDYDDFRADLAALLSHVRTKATAGPLILFGHSMGGGVVLDHGLSDNPAIDGVIASAPLIALPDPIGGFQRSLVGFLAKAFPNAAMKQPIEGGKISTLPAEQAAYEADALNHGQLGLRTAIAIIENGERLSDTAANWSLPLMMMHSTDDQLTDFTASQAFAQAARADFRSFSGVAHEMHNDTSRPQIYRAITDFVDLLTGRV